MTKERAVLPFRFHTADEEQQVPPLRYAPVGMTPLFRGCGFIREIRERRRAHCRSLRYAPVGMTKERAALPFRFDTADEE
jgi:hypothetical protein